MTIVIISDVHANPEALLALPELVMPCGTTTTSNSKQVFGRFRHVDHLQHGARITVATVTSRLRRCISITSSQPLLGSSSNGKCRAGTRSKAS